ncbi:MAG: hypothetical protein JW986_04100 [Methanotrichaceae archaeon]|nr:hypothetical protein [Methanotrichaceae archaeon]
MTSDDKAAEGKDELQFIVRAAQQGLPEGLNHRIGDILSFVEGMAPFLDKETIMKMKCRECDEYASSYFPLGDEYDVVDSHEYCHEKAMPFHHLSLFAIAKCTAYSKERQIHLERLALDLVEELHSLLVDKKLYDRRTFACFPIDFQATPHGRGVFIELGHTGEDGFSGSGIRLHLLERLDPGFGPFSSEIERSLAKGESTLVAEASNAARRALDLDRILGRMAERRKMNIVYL